MSATSLARKANPVNVRDAQAQLSKLIRSKSPTMVLSHGKPVSFLVPHEDLQNLDDTLDELKDIQLLREIERARIEYGQGEAVPTERFFKKMGVQMDYGVVFPSERVERLFQKTLKNLPNDYRIAFVAAVRSLDTNPRPQSKRTKKLIGELTVSQFTAEYRLRVGPSRILYDIDDLRKKVALLKLAKRNEETYG